MIQILFVCLGNICRSTMAEAVMRHKIQQAGLQDRIAVDSAGTSDWHIGEPPHEGTRRRLEQADISFAGIRARRLAEADAEQFDLIIGMDSDNIREINRILPEARPRTRLLSDYAGGSWMDVPDPWYTKNYDETFHLVSEGCEGLLQALTQQL